MDWPWASVGGAGCFLWRSQPGVHGAGRRGIRRSEPDGAVWAFAGKRPVGAAGYASGQLASADRALPHAGLPFVRLEGRRTSFHQLAPPCCQHRPSVSGPEPDDGSQVALRPGVGPFWLASAARGISGLDRGAKGCLEHVLLHGHPLGLCHLRSAVPTPNPKLRDRGPKLRRPRPEVKGLAPLSPVPRLLRLGADEQAHAGDHAVRAVAPRLLAAAPRSARHGGHESRHCPHSVLGERAVLRLGSSRRSNHVLGAETHWRDGSYLRDPASNPRGQRVDIPYALSGQDALARGPCGVLPVSSTLACLAGGGGGCGARRHHGLCRTWGGDGNHICWLGGRGISSHSRQ